MDYLEGIENPYSTFIAYNEGATKKQIAEAYWSDLIELLELPIDHGIEALERAKDIVNVNTSQTTGKSCGCSCEIVSQSITMDACTQITFAANVDAGTRTRQH